MHTLSQQFPTAEAKAAQEQLLEQAIIAAAEAKHPLAGATLEELDEAEVGGWLVRIGPLCLDSYLRCWLMID